MLTSVFKDILDHSIPAEKFGGGSMYAEDEIDLFYAWRIITGNSLTKGRSFVDSVDIGTGYGFYLASPAAALPSDGYFRYLRVYNRAATSVFDVYSNSGIRAIKLSGSSVTGGLINIYNTTGSTRTNLSSTSSGSYFLDKVIIGSPSTLKTQKLCIVGGVNADTISTVLGGTDQDLATYIEAIRAQAIETKNDLDGFGADSWAAMKNVSLAQWLIVGELNQGLSIQSEVQFKHLGLSNGIIIAYGDAYRFNIDGGETTFRSPDGYSKIIIHDDEVIFRRFGNTTNTALEIVDDSVSAKVKFIAEDGVSNSESDIGLKWKTFRGTKTVDPSGADSIAIDLDGISIDDVVGWNVSIIAPGTPKYLIAPHFTGFSSALYYNAYLSADGSSSSVFLSDCGVNIKDLTVKYRIMVYYLHS